jgi:signal transduction histidine kinase/ActR/RegA family two-component response regulator
VTLHSATQALRRRPWLGYPAAILLSLAALWARLALAGLFEHSPFLLFIIAVALSAFLAGLGPAILAAIVSGLLADYFLLQPVGSLGLVWPQGWIAIAIYAGVAAIVIMLIDSVVAAHEFRRQSERRLLELNAELEARVAAAIAEREQAQEALRHSQKMEAIGQLTGGIAHDFNNMLAIVTGSLDMAERRLTGDEHPKLATSIAHAAEGARRAALLTQRLLAFSRQQPLAPQALDAGKLVLGMSELLRRTIGEHIAIETVLGAGLWPCFADPAQLENALINLAVNARDAMPDGGRLTIETANTTLDARYAEDAGEVAPGHYVLIAVSDTGTGMAPDVIGRAFDPFFTTKSVGQGTGLGLSQVFGYVKQSGGHVKIYSEAGQGTAVKVYLPRHASGAVTADERMPPAATPAGGPDTIILVVEDEAQVRAMTVDALRDLGYTVLQAGGGAEALEVLAAAPRIHLLLTDIVMPGMNGRQLAERIEVLRPGTRVLFTTGYTRNAVVHNGMLDAGVAFLPKPFTVDQLARKVHDVLAGAGANRV